MRILRNYILLECTLPFFLALGVLTSVFLLGNLLQLANMVINKGVSLLSIAELFLLSVPLLLGYTLPLACLVGITLALGRLSTDNEIIAIRASGISLWRLLMPIICVGAILSLLLFILNDRVIPYAYQKQRELLKSLGKRNPTALLEAGVFIKSFDNQILFINRIEDYRLYNVNIYQLQPDGKTSRTIVAKQGEFSPVPNQDSILLKLMNGSSEEPDPKNPSNYYRLNFETFFMTLDLSNNSKGKVDKKPKAMSLSELKQEQERLEKRLVKITPLITEYWRKITWAFSPLIFILLAFPVAVITNKRQGKARQVFIVILLAMMYYLLSLGCEALSLQQVAGAEILMWIPNLLGLTAAIILNMRLIKS